MSHRQTANLAKWKLFRAKPKNYRNKNLPSKITEKSITV